MPCVGFEPTIPASERAKTVYALDRSATVTGLDVDYLPQWKEKIYDPVDPSVVSVGQKWQTFQEPPLSSSGSDEMSVIINQWCCLGSQAILLILAKVKVEDLIPC
jgi:hypothetical protein